MHRFTIILTTFNNHTSNFFKQAQKVIIIIKTKTKSNIMVNTKNSDQDFNCNSFFPNDFIFFNDNCKVYILI